MSACVPELVVRSLSATDRLVALPPIRLTDARTGACPRLSTAVRVGLRGAKLCVRFDGRDDGVVATYRERDAPLWKEDVFEVFLAAEDPPRRYFEFEVNPLGALFDARVESPELSRVSMHVDTTWDCAGLEARVTCRPDRWSALLTIPLASLCDGLRPSHFRANFFRIDRGAIDEFTAWSPAGTDPADFHVPERFGVLRWAEGSGRGSRVAE
jgi:hypothetical protein